MMPGMDGFETCRRLKAGPAAHVPVIFMTALSETEHVVAGLEAGGVDYVTKPIRLDELLARIRVHLGNARAAQSARAALDTSGASLLALDRAGRVAVVDPAARPRCSRAVWADDGALPAELGAAARRAAAPRPDPVVAAGADGRLALGFAYLGRRRAPASCCSA